MDRNPRYNGCVPREQRTKLDSMIALDKNRDIMYDEGDDQNYDDLMNEMEQQEQEDDMGDEDGEGEED
jgi:hypothetical protein